MQQREPREGAWIAGCRLESQIGRGGMGTVWRAWQERAQRTVALKLIRSGLSDDPGIRERFRREAQLVVALVTFGHFRTTIPSNWVREGAPERKTDRDPLGEATVTTFRPRDPDAPDRVFVFDFGSGKEPPDVRTDRRQAILDKPGTDYAKPNGPAGTFPVGIRPMVVWEFDLRQGSELLRWKRYAFDISGVAFEVAGGGRPREVANVAGEVASSLDLRETCESPTAAAPDGRIAIDVIAINAPCDEAGGVVGQALACAQLESCTVGDYRCGLDGDGLSCRAPGRRRVNATILAPRGAGTTPAEDVP